MQKTKSVVVNKTGKVEVHTTDNQSWNSCRKVVADREFTFGSAIEPTTRKARWIRFEGALHMATDFSQTLLPLPLGCTGRHVCLLR